MYWGSNRKSGSLSRKKWVAAIFLLPVWQPTPSGRWFSPYFGPCGRPIACDASSIGPGTKMSSRYTTSGSVKSEVRFLAAISAPKAVPALRQRGPSPSPRALRDANACAARVRSRRVLRTLKTIYNESVFFTCLPIGDSLRKKQTCDFLENLSSDFCKISYERAPHTALPNDAITDPPPNLGAGPGGPKIWGNPPKFSHFRFSRVGIFSTVCSARWSPQKFGV